MLKAVLFDMDGVLLDSESLHFEAIDMLLKEIGIKKQDGGHEEKLQGVDYETIWEHMRKKYSIDKSTKELLDMQIKCTCKYFSEIELVEMKGLSTFLKDLKDNQILCGVGSSSPLRIIEQVLLTLNISKYMDDYCGAESVEKLKPFPDLYLQVTENLCVKPTECVVFEDSGVGVMAAKKAGMKCILVQNQLNCGCFENVDMTISDFTEINYARVADLFTAVGKKQRNGI